MHNNRAELNFWFNIKIDLINIVRIDIQLLFIFLMFNNKKSCQKWYMKLNKNQILSKFHTMITSEVAQEERHTRDEQMDFVYEDIRHPSWQYIRHLRSWHPQQSLLRDCTAGRVRHQNGWNSVVQHFRNRIHWNAVSDKTRWNQFEAKIISTLHNLTKPEPYP